MNAKMPRRDFLKAAPVAALAMSQAVKSLAVDTPPSAAKLAIEPFNYDGVKLGNSRWQQQYQASRDYYLNVPNDDILHGYRAAAGLPAPGQALGGWCSPNSNTVFGQWLSGMSRFVKAGNDTAMRDKVIALFTEWAKTVPDDGNCRMGHYPFEKLVGGLVDMQLYAGYPDTTAMLEKVVDYASKNFNRDRLPAGPVPWAMHSGRPGEWYTVGENAYRAYQLTGNPKFKDFADIWLYHDYWNKFADTAAPTNAHSVHAYSHVNSFSSAAMAYAVTGDTKYLSIIKNAYDFLKNTQWYATGGVGPVERIMPPGGMLGKALDYHQNSCETPCCSWASFKLARYLTEFTGEARYGDWVELLMYNGIGGILPITGHGKHFYYADYRVAGGVKVYAREMYTCCSGTYCQATSDYPNQIYYKDPSSLYVSLYLPSEVTWKRPDGEVKLTQETRYPEAETSTFTLNPAKDTVFALKFRVPGWSNDMSVKVNGEAANVVCKPGTWAVIQRTWKPDDKVEVTIPLRFRYSAVDKEHPHRIAVVRGPMVMVQEGNAHEPIFKLPDTEAELNKWLVPMDAGGGRGRGGGGQPGFYTMHPADGATVQAHFLPFYAAIESLAYRMYFDNDKLPFVLW
jgi:uncharacterized protein